MLPALDQLRCAGALDDGEIALFLGRSLDERRTSVAQQRLERVAETGIHGCALPDPDLAALGLGGVRSALDAAVVDPSVGKALRDELAGLRSCRIGRFRIIYRVAGAVIEIVAVGPRTTIHAET